MAKHRPIWARIRDEGTAYLVRTGIVLVAGLVAYLLITATGVVKGMLGLTAIETQLREVQEELTATEDTIYSYKYDYTVPNVHDFRRLLSSVGVEHAEAARMVAAKHSEFEAFLKKYKKLTDVDKQFLRDARDRLTTQVTRTFYFAAAEHTESTLSYELQCITDNGEMVDGLFISSVKVNNKPVGSYNEGKGTTDLKSFWRAVEPVSSKTRHHFYKQNLSFSLFGTADDARLIVDLGIERCSFDALIFVRDVHPRPKAATPGHTDVFSWSKKD